jgi:hypothetical protein
MFSNSINRQLMQDAGNSAAIAALAYKNKRLANTGKNMG